MNNNDEARRIAAAKIRAQRYSGCASPDMQYWVYKDGFLAGCQHEAAHWENELNQMAECLEAANQLIDSDALLKEIENLQIHNNALQLAVISDSGYIEKLERVVEAAKAYRGTKNSEGPYDLDEALADLENK